MKIEIPKLIENFGGNTLDSIIRIMSGKLSEIHTTTIGIIESFDNSTQTANIQPAIKRIVTIENIETITYTSENYPLLVNVPVVFPGGGDWFITFPVKKGDECLLFSMERSIGNWKKNGGIQDPSNYKRKLSFKDVVAMVGIQSQASSLPSFNSSEPEFRNRDGSVALTMNSSGMNLKGDLTVEGEVTAKSNTLVVNLSTHMHPTAATGSPSSPTPGT